MIILEIIDDVTGLRVAIREEDVRSMNEIKGGKTSIKLHDGSILITRAPKFNTLLSQWISCTID